MKIITLTTDFGSTDPFIGAMKGVILNICSNVRIEDITCDISLCDIRHANFVLQTSYHYFPKGTIHLCVVDPGVGSARKPILIESKNYCFIGPDNGLFTGVLEKEKIKSVIELTEKKYWLKNTSKTFHGRDIFSPVAAHLASGVKVKKFGKVISKNKLTKLPTSKLHKSKNKFTGIVQYIDHFGNLITSIPNGATPECIRGKVNGYNFNGLVKSFSYAKKNKLTATCGSSGYIEIFVYKGSAAKKTGSKVNDKVEILLSDNG